MNWDADLYLQFAKERTRPSSDLISRINLLQPQRIIDLGCGPGNSTAMLRQKWLQADITGLDNSPEMIAAASKSYPSEKWVLSNIASWSAEIPFDLVFSNATLQWLPNHGKLFAHLFSQVALGGALAIQVPAHYQSPLRQVVDEVSKDPLWSDRMDRARNALTFERPRFYYDVLQPLAKYLEIWETEYYHVMDSPKAIVNWFRGTGLRPFLGSLESEQQKEKFEQMLLEGYTKAYPQQNDGRILFPFRRLFIIAYR
ncbi:methyltransferase domain-containing protein [Tumidithrix elongata RA019]|uniref:Methyltransferase domain-containing protein n=1 Tax=Tumidithrix elongata BACA0141 TaxID=2716417 RepID=A0AAW9PY23_9CYAN|nr:methyltransferase domain-containing protein [Tumidithrix elongata RA019]